jgi:hypothetical protein
LHKRIDAAVVLRMISWKGEDSRNLAFSEGKTLAPTDTMG